MRYISCTLIFSIFFTAVFAQPNKNISSGKAVHNTYAVVVGISQYGEDNNIPSLKYAHRDAQEFANFLQSRSGGSVPDDNIRLLLNENATMSAVYNALDWLEQVCKKDDLVYFYFAGHGDKERKGIYELGFLLTYNTPRPNYKNHSLRIEDLSDCANTLSARNNANVVLITDACHSGDITGTAFHWSSLVGEDLRKVKKKEIRIASCGTNQLSAEDKAWGGGRGAFSWYLVNGLKGLADKDGDGTVTVKDIQRYLDSCFVRDPVLAGNNIKQNPVVSGDDNFKLAEIDKTARMLMIGMAAPVVQKDQLSALPPQPQEEFFNFFKTHPIENEFNFFALDKLSKDQIAFALLDSMSDTSDPAVNGIAATLKTSLLDDPDRIDRFNEKLVETIDNRGEQIINAYLKGDEAELERRRYYNISKNGYDEYPVMFSVAAKLTSPNNRLKRILIVDQHYFAGVVARLKIPTVEDPKELIAISFAEQQKALDLDDNAACIQNEMGNLYLLKNDPGKSVKYYQRATQIAPDWAIPWANLCGIYAEQGKTADAINAARIADSLQAGLQITSVQLGYAYERSGNNLFAEEYYRKSIDINSRHFLPFERLGYVYNKTTQYEMADSFFYEASLRKKGYHFNGTGFLSTRNVAAPLVLDVVFCNVKENELLKDDVMGFFYFGKKAYDSQAYTDAESFFKKIIAVERSNPLVYHYLGKIYYDQGKWERAEIMFKHEFKYYRDQGSFKKYCDSVSGSKTWHYDHPCLDSFFRNCAYESIEDYYFIASVYERWGHWAEAEQEYRTLTTMNPAHVYGYIKLWRIMENLGRYPEAEQILKDFEKYNPETAFIELNDFYKRAMEHYPTDPAWPYKLGLLLYERSYMLPQYEYLDTIVFFPLVNKEIFLGVEEHNNLVENNNMLLNIKQPPGLEGMEARVKLLYPTNGAATFPGTNEHITMAPDVYTPRKDAIMYLSKAAEMIKEPETIADINFKIGNVFVLAGSKKQAYPYYDMAIKMSPDNGAFRLKMVDIAHDLFKNTTALENLDYLYQQKQINFPDRMLLAEFDIHAGRFDSAKKVLDEAKIIYPYDVPAITDLNGRLALLSKKYQQALSAYSEYLAINNGDKETTYTIATIYAKMGKPDALKWLETAMKKGFNYSWVLKYDDSWEKYRSAAKWKELMAKYPNERKYVSPFEN